MCKDILVNRDNTFTVLKATFLPSKSPLYWMGVKNQVEGFCNCSIAFLGSANTLPSRIGIYVVLSFFYRYVDVILQLIDKAGDFVSDDIWFRVVQFVTNNEDLQVSLKLELTVVVS